MSKKILVLGAGMVAGPLISYLEGQGYELLVTDIDPERAREKAEGFGSVTSRQLDIEDQKSLRDLVAGCDLAVSLLPADLHTEVARHCIDEGKHLVTASYVSPGMAALDPAAREAGIILLNEMGVDPGIDHMSAMQLFDGIRKRGGRIAGFLSYCGGLPAPGDNTNPLGYKFSWSPLGVLKAAASEARYLRQGKSLIIHPEDLFGHYWLVDTGQAGVFEAYPNRDSLEYAGLYGLEEISTLCRGTLRNIGHCDTWYILSRMGFFSDAPLPGRITGSLQDYILVHLLGGAPGEDLPGLIAGKFNLRRSSIILKKLEWLGLFSDEPVPVQSGGPRDVLAAVMLKKMAYRPGERDMLVMHHDITAEYDDHSERITSTLLEIGEEGGESAMARTVGLPAAVGARLILEDRIRARGVVRPLIREIYDPVLEELSRLGISLQESRQKGEGGK